MNFIWNAVISLRNSRSALLALFVLTTAVSVARSACWVTWDCQGKGARAGCIRTYGSNTGRNGPFASCDGWQQLDLASKCTCDGTAAAGSSDPMNKAAELLVDSMFKGNQQGMAMGAGLMGASMLGQGLGQMLRGDPAADARRRAAEAAAAQAAAEEAERQRLERERMFNDNKNRLLQEMGGAPAAGAANLGFKDDDELRPRPLVVTPNTGPAESCSGVIDSCADEMAANSALLEEERAGAASFHAAIIQGHMQYGLDLAKSAGFERLGKEVGVLSGKTPGWEKRPAWENKTAAGTPMQSQPWQISIDGIFGNMFKERVGALNGKYDSPKRSLLESDLFAPPSAEDLYENAEGAVEGAKNAAGYVAQGGIRKDFAALKNGALERVKNPKQLKTDFDRFMDKLMSCGEVSDERFNQCVKDAADAKDTLLDQASALGDGVLSPATSRVNAAQNAYTDYVKKFAGKTTASMERAAKCLGSCAR